MPTGTLIAHLFEAVKRAEKAAAEPFSPPPEQAQEVLVGVEVDTQPSQPEDLEPELEPE